MAVRVAINGFGRIGRLAFRQMFGAEGYEVVAINDLTSPKMLAHLLKYDSSQGKYEHADEVSASDDSITVCGKEIKIYAFPDANNCPWGELKVDVVLECSGFYTSKEKAQAHINAGARKVVISAPAGNDLPTIVYNTNHETLKASDTIISAASCTTNCLAPMADALNKFAPIQSGIMVTIHAYTGDQMTLDGPQRKGDLRRSRAAAVNIVPNSTGAAKAIGLVIPELNGKLIGSAQRVPTPTGSTTILTAVVKKAGVTKEDINAAMKAAANESFGYNEDEIVSSDIVGMRFGSLFDENYRKELEEIAEKQGLEILYKKALDIDPIAMEKISENDKKRIMRVLEIYKATGKTKTQQEIESRQKPIEYDYKVFAINWDREKLYQRINKRVDIMIEQGLIEEVKNILEKYNKFPTALQGLGYKEVVDYLNGIYTKEEMIEKIKMETRRYAKRQLTWFRKNKQTTWLEGTNEIQNNVNIILEVSNIERRKQNN